MFMRHGPVRNHRRGLGRPAHLGLGLFCITVALAAQQAAATDRIELFSGDAVEGEIVDQSEYLVVISVTEGETAVRRVYPMRNIVSITRDFDQLPAIPEPSPALESAIPGTDLVDAGPIPPDADAPRAGYVTIPLQGVVGQHITAEVLRECLEDANQFRAAAVLLEIDSNGGLISEMLAIIDLLHQWQDEHDDVQVVAVVKGDALSAAAIISAACRTIVVHPESTIGGAKPVRIGPDRHVTAVDEKFQSVFRAKARVTADLAGHDPILVEAMTDQNITLMLTVDDAGEPAIRRVVGSVALGADEQLLTSGDRLLTMTAREAAQTGLAAAVVESTDEVLEAIDLGGAPEIDSRARQVATEYSEDVDRAHRDYQRIVERVRRIIAGMDEPEDTLAGLMRRQRELYSIRGSLVRLDRLSREYAWLASWVERDCEPYTLAMLKEKVDQALEQTDQRLREHRMRRLD